MVSHALRGLLLSYPLNKGYSYDLRLGMWYCSSTLPFVTIKINEFHGTVELTNE